MKAVIIGSTGFLGRYLLRRLNTSGANPYGVGSRNVDLTSPSAPMQLRDIIAHGDTLVMIAAITRDKGRDADTFLRNVQMGAHVAAVIRAGVGHVVYVSSDAVYGDTPGLPITEKTPLNPACLYGAAHVAREIMLREECSAAGVPLAIVRPTILYGPGDTHGNYGPNRFFRTAPHGTITLFGAGEERRDLLFVEDAAALLEQVITTRTTGVFNVATGTSHSFDEMAQMVAAASPLPVVITSQPRVGAAHIHRHFDVSALSRAFPDVRYTSLHEGIRQTAAAVFDHAVPSRAQH